MTAVVRSVFDVGDLVNKRKRFCSACHKVEIEAPLSRCKECNAVNMRVLRCKKSMDEGSIEAWDNMSKEKKAEFIKESHELLGNELKAKMKMVATQEMESKQTISIRGKGLYKDSTDLEIKYQDRLEQLENIKRNANTFLCPTRGVQVWEDLEYMTTFREEVSQSNKRKFELSTEDTRRGKPKPKQPKAIELGTARSTESIQSEPENPKNSTRREKQNLKVGEIYAGKGS